MDHPIAELVLFFFSVLLIAVFLGSMMWGFVLANLARKITGGPPFPPSGKLTRFLLLFLDKFALILQAPIVGLKMWSSQEYTLAW